jgi:acetyl esterase/lipase
LFALLCFAADPLNPAHLEAIHAQRVEWMKKRVVRPPQGIYQDYRAVQLDDATVTESVLRAAKSADVQVLLRRGESPTEVREGIIVRADDRRLPAWVELDSYEIDPPKVQKRFRDRFKAYPDEIFAEAGGNMPAPYQTIFRHKSTHLLATELTPDAIAASIEAGRGYGALDWLCDPAGFLFIAENNFGSYDIGDTVPMINGTHLLVNLPIPGTIRILRDKDIGTGDVVAERTDSKLVFPVTEQGSYRVEVLLTIAGQQRNWLNTNPIRFGNAGIRIPSAQMSPDVEIHKDIPYLDDNLTKHKLDLYLPKGKKDFPVLVFYHGGAWHTGDRSQYPLLGNRFAKAGIGVAIPSYRLMPQSPHPAQIEDAAAAFAWVHRNIAEHGGDVSKIYIAGHSAGGHLASLLALDPEWLKKYDISPGVIRGVATMSGIYDVSEIVGFKSANASPIRHVHPRTPPFLITYCQWDYLGLPRQAREFAAALKKEFIETKLIYVPGESHISEIIASLRDDDPTARAILEFVK